MRHWLIGLGFLIILSFAGFQAETSEAQLGGTCTALVQEALVAIGNNCAELGRNSACYGYNQVQATFIGQKPVDFFTQPADQAQVFDIQELNTAPLNVTSAEWGIAVLNVQANLPDSIPGEAVRFLLFGDVTVENAVDPSAETMSSPVADVMTINDVAMRTRPTSQANVSAEIPANTQLQADQRSVDGDWIRVVYNDLAGWVPLDALDAADALDTLLTADRTPYTPMQAFRLRTNLMGISCTDAPPSLAVMQGPQHMTINLNVNGANLTVGSTIALWTADTSAGSIMVLAVIDGGVYLDDGTYIPAGFIAQVALDAAGNVTGVWSQPRPMTLDEWLLFEPLEGVPGNILNYPIVVPSELIADLQPTPTPLPTLPPVVSGNTPILSTPDIIQVDCAGLRPTSPLGGLPFGDVTFFWDGISSPLITAYRVNLYRDGALVANFGTPAGHTNVSGNLSGVPVMGMYTWEVQALVNGVAICTASTNVSQRAFPTDVPVENPAQPPVEVSPEPTAEVSPEPTVEVSPQPTAEVTAEPTVEVSPEPTVEVSPEPTPEVTPELICNLNQICDNDEDPETCSDCVGENICGNKICEPPSEDVEICRRDCNQDKGHGNDEDGVDEDNPGRGPNN
ncbi:MAG: procyclic acidic repetitive family protein [Anaerolineae bacterium]|nr:procyclic acidic repetitive family protein [Anaerolineae bacterium]